MKVATDTTQAKRKRARQTKEKLVEKAIELFARHGIQGVSLRTVMDKAGAKNTAAVSYHFGNREALLIAALDKVLEATAQEVTLAESAKLGYDMSFDTKAFPETELNALIAFAMLPIITLPHRKPWGEDGIKLLARIIMGEAQELAPHLEGSTVTDSLELLDSVSDIIPQVPKSVLKNRIDFVFVNLICGMASVPYLAAVEKAGISPMQPQNMLARQLVDYAAGGLRALATAPSEPSNSKA